MKKSINTKKSFQNGLKAQAENWDNHNNLIFQWMPAILAIAGLFISWELNAIIGWAFSIAGAMYGWFSTKNLNKIISIVLATVVTILVIITIAL